MPLAQPTNLQVKELEPFATLEQNVSRENPGGVFATLKQHTGLLRANSGGPFATLEQTVTFLRENPGGVFATFEQTVSRTNAGGVFARLRQTVQSPTPATALQRHTLIYLDDEDITRRCSIVYAVTASAGDNRTATVTYQPPSGPINIPSFQGREIEIHRRIQGVWQPIFVGKVDVPTYNRDSRTLQLRCTDLRNERIAKEDQAHLKTLTGGLYSNVTQREEATGREWVRELMKTVEGSLDYTGAGALRYRPWAITTPRYALEPGDIHYREIDMTFATRSEIVNRVKIDVGFRWFKRRTLTASVGASVARGGLCSRGECLPARGQSLPTREAALQAAYNINNWQVTGVAAGTPPPSGWYKQANPLAQPVAYISSETFQQTYATSVSASLIRWVSQGQRWTDAITIEAPQSVDQFGAIDGSEMSFSVDTATDPGVFEESGCYTKPEQDRIADRNLAIEIAQRMAAKQIRASHRQNYASFRYKPKTGRAGAWQLLAVEIGDTLSVTSDEITVTGWVSEFTHQNTNKGDTWTDIRLAVSRVDSAVEVTESLTVPAVGTPNKLNKRALEAEPTACGGGEAAGETENLFDLPGLGDFNGVAGDGTNRSEIAMDGSITLVAPAIPADKTDELVGESSVTYSIAIPVNTFTVEVP